MFLLPLAFFESQLLLRSLLLLAPLLCIGVATVVNITSLLLVFPPVMCASADVNVAAVATSFLLLPQLIFKAVALAGVLKINLL
jgi:hypothetical protein